MKRYLAHSKPSPRSPSLRFAPAAPAAGSRTSRSWRWRLLLCLAPAALAAAADSDIAQADVFVSGRDGYHAYRIPALEAAPDGSLLAFAEARKYNLGDPGMNHNEIDLVLKRSTDGGRTWSAMQVVEHAGERWSAANPATVVDRQSGRVWLHYLRCKPNRNTHTARPGTDDVQNLVRFSDDHGLTWSGPTDLTAVARDMSDAQWRCSVVGPGGAIQDRKGRLVAAVWKYAPWGVFAISSDDHGRTWRRGQPVPGGQPGDENQLIELADGRLLMDYRQQKGGHRWLTVSRDGGASWGEPRPGLAVTPVCCAIERYTLKSAGADRDRIIWTGPKGPGRATLVMRVSYDEAERFGNERLIAEGPAAYSDLATLKDKSIGVLWERGNYKFITFTRVTRAFLEPK
ncbi:MAG: exo-alpha-sialidase [Verrucomicrobia bacterium]|nr:exo-alpha-sialidase [Verrucomicrobiota bacterium]